MLRCVCQAPIKVGAGRVLNLPHTSMYANPCTHQYLVILPSKHCNARYSFPGFQTRSTYPPLLECPEPETLLNSRSTVLSWPLRVLDKLGQAITSCSCSSRCCRGLHSLRSCRLELSDRKTVSMSSFATLPLKCKSVVLLMCRGAFRTELLSTCRSQRKRRCPLCRRTRPCSRCSVLP